MSTWTERDAGVLLAWRLGVAHSNDTDVLLAGEKLNKMFDDRGFETPRFAFIDPADVDGSISTQGPQASSWNSSTSSAVRRGFYYYNAGIKKISTIEEAIEVTRIAYAMCYFPYADTSAKTLGEYLKEWDTAAVFREAATAELENLYGQVPDVEGVPVAAVRFADFREPLLELNVQEIRAIQSGLFARGNTSAFATKVKRAIVIQQAKEKEDALDKIDSLMAKVIADSLAANPRLTSRALRDRVSICALSDPLMREYSTQLVRLFELMDSYEDKSVKTIASLFGVIHFPRIYAASGNPSELLSAFIDIAETHGEDLFVCLEQLAHRWDSTKPTAAQWRQIAKDDFVSVRTPEMLFPLYVTKENPATYNTDSRRWRDAMERVFD